MRFEISDLRERPEFFDIVADRIWQAWWKPRGVALAYIQTRLRENLVGAALPIALVAHCGDEFLGTASLIASDLDERPYYTPWVAAVWTEPHARRQGIAPALIDRAVAEGFARGHARVYLCACPARRGFYRELGWIVLEEDVGPHFLSVFVCDRVCFCRTMIYISKLMYIKGLELCRFRNGEIVWRSDCRKRWSRPLH